MFGFGLCKRQVGGEDVSWVFVENLSCLCGSGVGRVVVNSFCWFIVRIVAVVVVFCGCMSKYIVEGLLESVGGFV